jgi:3'-phosphoadenosine 5'-phosphosulfate sulfotransferase (PAPS reductase)/FAD synthetase
MADRMLASESTVIAVSPEHIRHICGISGGKDSSALAIYLRDRIPDMEYFFCDTGAELPETYDYLLRLEAVLGRPITRLNSDRSFDHWFEIFRGTLPSPRMRWCTRYMKLKPLEAWVGDTTSISYVAIRSDEAHRKGYISGKKNIKTVFPFVEDGIDNDGVMRILRVAGIGLPSYYEWRTRSGCYFCFFQRRMEWIGLADRHPDLFRKAVLIEQKVLGASASGDGVSFKDHASKERIYTWSQGETLTELLAHREEILLRHQNALASAQGRNRSGRLLDLLTDALDSEDNSSACTMCAK